MIIDEIEPHLICIYQKNKSPGAGQPGRDFIEKKFIFSHDQSMYVYVSELPPSFNVKTEGKTIRGRTIIGINKIERLNNKQVKLTLFN